MKFKPIALSSQERRFIAAHRPQPTERPADGADSSWYRINNHDTNTAEVFIYDEIGYWGVTASDFLNDLAQLQAPTINVRINSPGGDVFDGIAIFNALLSHPATVNTTVDALAASAASFIAMAGETLTMSRHSQMMIHDASGIAIGNAADMQMMANLLDRISANIASMYAERAGGTTDKWRTAMRDETWYDAQEAVDAGLADTVAPVPTRGNAAGDDPTDPTGDDPAAIEPGAENASRPIVLTFIHKGRDDAPAPYVPAAADSAGTAAPEFDQLRLAVRDLRPVASIADQLRSAYKEASK